MHAIIPIILLLAFFPKLNKKYIFLLLPIVWIIDLDLFLGNIHRFLFHNLFFVFVIAFIVYLIWNKRAFFVALFYGFSHLILDLGYPGVAFLYPFIEQTLFIKTTIQKTSEWFVNFGIGSVSPEEYRFFAETEGISYYITEATTVIFILITILLIVKYRKEIKSFFSKGP